MQIIPRNYILCTSRVVIEPLKYMLLILILRHIHPWREQVSMQNDIHTIKHIILDYLMSSKKLFNTIIDLFIFSFN